MRSSIGSRSFSRLKDGKGAITMAQMVINSFTKNVRVPKNLRVTVFNVFKSSTVWLVMNSNSTGTSVQVYTSVTAMCKIRTAVIELLHQLSGRKFKKALFKRVAAAHADYEQINGLLEQLVTVCEEFVA